MRHIHIATLRVTGLVLASLALSACLPDFLSGSGRQGWSEPQRETWYRATQGSRMMPYSWFMALEQSVSTARFSDPANLSSFGFIAGYSGEETGLPIGFAIDRQDEAGLKNSGLHWYEGQSAGADDAERWIGLNCSACHTAEIRYQGEELRIDGGPANLDFQSFVEEMDAAMVATRGDAGKWDRFAANVLSERDTPESRALLKKAVDRHIAWQAATDRLNETALRYGYARLDAFGHIYNKVLMFAGGPQQGGNPSDAPVSFPFLWNIHKQERVQWNGVVRNSRFATLEYGSLGRNTGEVLGVFGDITIEPFDGSGQPLAGYRSSVATTNLDRLETLLTKLEAPKWPASFPSVDTAMADRGKAIFKEKRCDNCHLTSDLQEKGKPTERMMTFQRTSPQNLTDIWMACNAYLYKGPSGILKGTKVNFIDTDPDADRVGDQAKIVTMLSIAVKGALANQKGDIVEEALAKFLGINRPPVVIEPGFTTAERAGNRNVRRQACLTDMEEGVKEEDKLLAYKARPLDGIWATAPYLHNGSVPTLYDLLQPASERPETFWVGSREFDPVKVGFATDQAGNPQGFLFNTRNPDGSAKDANSNTGHEYGVNLLTEDERMDLLEYLKTL